MRAVFLILVAVVATALAAAPAHAGDCAKTPTGQTLSYASRAGVDPGLTSLDLWVPSAACRKGRAAPVVLWVHGGGYQRGDKANQIADKVRLFTRKGYAFASVNYRLTRPGQTGSARYPDHFRDVAAAVAWTRRTVDRYGANGKRIALLGHSAGADIVANVTVDPQWLREQGLPLTAVRCAGPLDTEGFDKTAAGALESTQWLTALGNEPNYLRSTSATLLVRRGTGVPRTITVVRGTAQRRAIETGFARALKAAGVRVTTIEAGALTHEQVNSRIGAAGDTVMTKPLTTFLSGCFGR